MTKIIYESFVIMCQIVLKHENTKVSHQILRGGKKIKLHWSKITVPATFWFMASSKCKEEKKEKILILIIVELWKLTNYRKFHFKADIPSYSSAALENSERSFKTLPFWLCTNSHGNFYRSFALGLSLALKSG